MCVCYLVRRHIHRQSKMFQCITQPKNGRLIYYSSEFKHVYPGMTNNRNSKTSDFPHSFHGSLIDTFDFSKKIMGNFLLLFFHFPLATKRKGKDWFGWCIKRRGARFSLSSSPLHFLLFASIPKGIEVLSDRERMASWEGKKSFSYFSIGGNFSFVSERRRRKAHCKHPKSFVRTRETLSSRREDLLCTMYGRFFLLRKKTRDSYVVYECTYVGWLA